MLSETLTSTMSCMTRRVIHTHRSHGHGIALMREDDHCLHFMRHVQCRQPVLQHIESNPALISESPQMCGPSALPAISMFSSQCTPSTRRCKLKEPARKEVTARRTSGDNREGPDKSSRPPKDTVAKNMRRGANGLARQSVGPPPSPPSSPHLLLPLLYHTQHLSSTSWSWCLPRAQNAASLRNWRLADVDAFTQNQIRWWVRVTSISCLFMT